MVGHKDFLREISSRANSQRTLQYLGLEQQQQQRLLIIVKVYTTLRLAGEHEQGRNVSGAWRNKKWMLARTLGTVSRSLIRARTTTDELNTRTKD